jgi:hypothetical protein
MGKESLLAVHLPDWLVFQARQKSLSQENP